MVTPARTLLSVLCDAGVEQKHDINRHVIPLTSRNYNNTHDTYIKYLFCQSVTTSLRLIIPSDVLTVM